MTHLLKISLLAALVCALAACAPLSPDLRIADVQGGSPAVAEFGINPNTATINSSRLRIYGVFDPFQSPRVVVDQASPSSPSTLGVLAPGTYFGAMEWTYQRLFSGTPETINSSSASFQVIEPNGCFSFNFTPAPPGAANWTAGTQGWTASQYFVADSNVLASQTAWPVIQPLNNQLNLLVNANALRANSTVPLWRTDLRTPSLENNAPWQTAQGMRFSIGANRYSNLNLQSQSILTVRNPDGSFTLFAEGTQANRVFNPITGTAQVSSPIALPPGSKVVGATVRIFGVLPLPAGPDISIMLDDVCPLP